MKFEYAQPVRYSETDENARLTLGALIDLFQDTSTMQSADIGQTVKNLQSQGLAWILSSWQIQIKEMPELYDPIVCTTWGYKFEAFFGCRNFTLSREGEVLVNANSYWVLYDVNNQKPVRINEDMIRLYDPEEPYPMDYAQRKLKPVKTGLPQEPFSIIKQHLDTNHHVNNGQYIQFAMNYLPEGASIREMRAEYKRQAHLGDRIHPLVEQQDGQTRVSLNTEDGKPYAVVEFFHLQ